MRTSWLITKPVHAFELFFSKPLERRHLHVDRRLELHVEFAIRGGADCCDHLASIEIFRLDREMPWSQSGHGSAVTASTIAGAPRPTHPQFGWLFWLILGGVSPIRWVTEASNALAAYTDASPS